LGPAVLVAAALGGLGWRLRALSAGGAAAAWLVGSAILIGTGWRGGVVLAVFFFTGSGISRAFPAAGDVGDAKGDRRDAWQVLANGSIAAAAALLGLLGMAADSLLGAVVQGKFRCPACRRPSERTIHQCGTPTIVERGWRWFSNDLVNFFAIGIAASVGWAVWLW
jgi:uncharacterized membrane protein